MWSRSSRARRVQGPGRAGVAVRCRFPAASSACRSVELPDVDMAGILAHTKTLSSDEFEGRAPGTKGEELTVAFLIDQFKKSRPEAGQRGRHLHSEGAARRHHADAGAARPQKRRGQQRTLNWKDDVVAWTKHVADGKPRSTTRSWCSSATASSRPEYDWDDYKGVDVKGKTLVMLVNDPPVPDPAKPGELDPKTFGGRAMTYYGRWTYKYEIGGAEGRRRRR